MPTRPRHLVLAALLASGLLAAGAPALAQEHAAAPAAAAPKAYIVNLKDGDTVKGPVHVIFGLQNYGVAPAGIDKPMTGHHHLLIDTTDVTAGQPLPAIPDKVVHFGGGQTETTLSLPPGKHTLMLVLGDKDHVPLTPSIQSEPITITVE